MSAIELQINDDHPLALELASLRAAVSRYQHEAHASSVKLQRHSLETSHALERTHVLERENAILREELAVLRSHPDISPHPATLQVNELTLSLRRLSDKLTYTEEALLTRTTQLSNALGEVSRAKHDAEAAYELAAKGRAREEEGKARERELESRVRVAEEERKMTDLVVQEYADLVRSLEGRKSSIATSRRIASDDGSASIASAASGSSTTLVESLSEGKSGLQKLMAEYNGEVERLEAEVENLRGQLNIAQAKLQAEQKSRQEDRDSMARARTQLDQLKADDNAAAKVVSRYMKFSQSTTDNLQNALSNLKTRHAATLASMDSDMQTLRKSLLDEKRQSDRLRTALDELSEDIYRETYGRRREVSLRLALLSREETIMEGLRRWSRRTQELLARTALADPSQVEGAFEKILRAVAALLNEVEGTPDVAKMVPASVARILAAQDAVNNLVKELQVEMAKRWEAERKFLQVAESTHEHGGLLVQRTKRKPSVSPPLPPLPSRYESESVATQVEERSDTSPPASVNLDSPTTPKLTPLPSVTDIPNSRQQDGMINSSPVFISGAPSIPSEDSAASVEQIFGSSDAISETPTLVSSSSISDQSSILLQTPPSAQHSPSLPKSGDLAVLKEPDIVLTENLPVAFPAPTEGVLFPSSEMQDIIPDTINPSPAVTPPTANPASTSTSPLLVTEIHLDYSEVSVPCPLPSSTLEQSAISELLKVKDRYDDLQRAFRECHQALKELKSTLSSASSMVASSSSSSLPILQTALQRLDDYNEDNRVELEIRLADEERVIRGYETLLTVQGAIPDQEERDAVEANIREFLEGSKSSAVKDREQFSKKLEDLQHDIAILKKATHELELVTTPPDASAAKKSPTWSSWTSGLLGNVATPSPSSPGPTFGSVMTTPRLRHTSSYTHLQANGRAPELKAAHDPFASLGLRIAMPSHVSFPQSGPGAPHSLSQPPPTRARTTSGLSGLYALGLGSRSSSMAISVAQRQRSTSTAHRLDNTVREDGGTVTDQESETETEESDSDGQTDVE
ncbi:hypothetical protein NEOLEDRAFT_1117271 [Neolentinus lepideus HHB14362 ss-1]|uniref:Uncharacterized protein n=1 Tax=Neolentinus lepideus HHB14362 ss-1 TaxID=1314782 RepID=A0A165RLI5_9AGAM|nr:hypothetical protein NEOLEDRAFT_1117271 [Neolentinus lepideus HHB14362 ss-1]